MSIKHVIMNRLALILARGVIVKCEATYILRYCVENSFLLSEHVKDPIENEIVNIILCILVSRLFSVLLKSELHFVILSVQNYISSE